MIIFIYVSIIKEILNKLFLLSISTCIKLKHNALIYLCLSLLWIIFMYRLHCSFSTLMGSSPDLQNLSYFIFRGNIFFLN